MIAISVLLATIAMFMIVGVVIAIAYILHEILKCMVKMAENQKEHSARIEKIEEQRNQDRLDMQLRISHIETRLNRMNTRKKGNHRW